MVGLSQAAQRDRRASAGVRALAAQQEARGRALTGEDEATRRIPIIFLTARADIRDRARGLGAGDLDYITKPFNPVRLAELVEGVVAAVERGEREDLRAEKLSALRNLIGSV